MSAAALSPPQHRPAGRAGDNNAQQPSSWCHKQSQLIQVCHGCPYSDHIHLHLNASYMFLHYVLTCSYCDTYMFLHNLSDLSFYCDLNVNPQRWSQGTSVTCSSSSSCWAKGFAAVKSSLTTSRTPKMASQMWPCASSHFETVTGSRWIQYFSVTPTSYMLELMESALPSLPYESL